MEIWEQIFEGKIATGIYAQASNAAATVEVMMMKKEMTTSPLSKMTLQLLHLRQMPLMQFGVLELLLRCCLVLPRRNHVCLPQTNFLQIPTPDDNVCTICGCETMLYLVRSAT